MSGDIPPEACGFVLLAFLGYIFLDMMESALLNYGRGGHSVSTPNVQKSDEHRKKNCAVENCNAVVFRMTDFCHRHQNETLVPSNKMNPKKLIPIPKTGGNEEPQTYRILSRQTPRRSLGLFHRASSRFVFWLGGLSSNHWLSPIHRFHKAWVRILR